MSSGFKKIIDLMAEICCLAIVFLLPLYFALFFKNANVFALNKIILFKILVSFLFLLVLLRGDWRQYFRRYKFFLVIPLFFLFFLVISTLFSPYFRKGFYGLYSRQQGLSSQIYYILFFFLLLANTKTNRQIERLTAVTVLSSFLVCLYGLLQVIGLDPLPWTESTSRRITATFGQPNFFASFLLLTIPLSVYLLFCQKRLLVKFFLSLVVGCELLCLFFTYSRAGWLGLAAGVFVSVIVFWFWIGKIRLNFGHLKFIFMAGFIFLFFILAAGQNKIFQGRIKHFFDFKSGSVAARLSYWRASWPEIKKRPWLGYGPESQGNILVRHYQKDWGVYNCVNTYPNRAHNLVLDTLLTSGFIGLAAYFLLLGYFFKFCFLNLKKEKFRYLTLAILTAVVGYLFSLLFGFATVTTNVYFWLYFALLAVMSRPFSALFPPPDSKQGAGRSKKNIFQVVGAVFLILIAVAVFGQMQKQIKILAADYYFRQMEEAYMDRDYFSVLELYGYVKENVPRYSYYDRQFAVIISDLLTGVQNPIYRRLAEIKLAAVLKSIKGDGYPDVLTRARIYTALAQDNKKYYQPAQEAYRKVIKISPEMPQNYRELAVFYFQQGEYGQAIGNYRAALSKMPDLNDSRLTRLPQISVAKETYLIYSGLSNVYLKSGDNQTARHYNDLAQNIKRIIKPKKGDG